MTKSLVIMRGLPGSGKSTVAKAMAAEHIETGGQTVAICSTDSFFLNKDGEYVFDASKLGKYHGMNQYKAHRHMFMGTELVIVDNTNTTHKEMKVYKQSAEALDYEVIEMFVGEEHLFPDPHAFADYIDTCARRNTHRVPREAIEKMARRFEQ